jgi:DNA-binding CsgD family transcriptional regulator
MLWEKATPISAKRPAAAAERLPIAQQTVLALMAEGLHDDAIARRAKLSTTTVRRHIHRHHEASGRDQQVRRRCRRAAPRLDRVTTGRRLARINR